MSMNYDEIISDEGEDLEPNHNEEEFELVEEQHSLDGDFDIVNMSTVVFDDSVDSEMDDKQDSDGKE